MTAFLLDEALALRLSVEQLAAIDRGKRSAKLPDGAGLVPDDVYGPDPARVADPHPELSDG